MSIVEFPRGMNYMPGVGPTRSILPPPEASKPLKRKRGTLRMVVMLLAVLLVLFVVGHCVMRNSSPGLTSSRPSRWSRRCTDVRAASATESWWTS
jgi:hypothetical protein